MAIISCPECGRQVSDKALQCPQCAYPIATPEPNEQVFAPKQAKNAFKIWIVLTSSAVLAVIVLSNLIQILSVRLLKSEVSKNIEQLDRQLVEIDGKNNRSSNRYSMRDYDSIRSGMSYSQVKAILNGDDGKELRRTENKGASTISYLWENTDGSSIIVLLQDDAVKNKAQSLLK